ncbi:sushi, von Willebrand factor type A, EGF and pentraxin domain-containing protein 1-like isoform X2 [Halichondria panicea]|uniref:sushi, von Willebrand factor type A, EGF and pentraxin domain-containing protein 1-like isoform X2 n=1 Tax=Halichondria panicea TaxID=6063 RepID=UPI00312B8BC4
MSAILLRAFALCLLVQAVKSQITMPMISSHPMDLVNVNAGTDVSFSVNATGDELVYQWMKDGVDIFNTPFKYVGTNTSNLTVLSVNDPDDEGIYLVTVGNAAGTVPSNETTLSIIDCTSLTVPIGGTISYSTGALSNTNYPTGTVADYCCTPGELLNGDATRHCLSGGAWSGRGPSCALDCTPLTDPTGGTISYSTGALSNTNYPLGTVATYSCTPGELFNGGATGTRHCLFDGTWSRVHPFCSNACPQLSLGGGRVIYTLSPNINTKYRLGTSASFDCTLFGHALTSAGRVTCVLPSGPDNGNGVWSGVIPSCSPIVCPDLADPTNGRVTFTTNDLAPFRLGIVAIYSCDPGYGLSSTGLKIIRTCVDLSSGTNLVGTWNGYAPNCSAIQCTALEAIDNGTISYNSTGNERFGLNTEATHTCTTGYFLSNGSDVVRVCGGDESNATGMWSGNVPMCTAITCPALPSIVDGELVDYGSNSPDVSDMLPFGAMGTYKCTTGFAPEGGAMVTRTCTANNDNVSGGSFEGVAVCVSIMCPYLADPINGTVTFSADGLAPFTLATVATYNCEPGYGLNSTDTRTCVDLSGETDPVGTWNGDAPTCSAIQCMTLEAIDNGTISYNPIGNGQLEFNTEATHTCTMGYFLSNGSDVRVCEGNDSSTAGMWSGTVPTCTAITCLALIVDGELVDYGSNSPDMSNMLPFGTMGTYTCATGFAPVGGAMVTRTCIANMDSVSGGSFDGVQAVCVSIMCPDLADPINGTVTFSADGLAPFMLATVATYSCEPGYGLNSTSTRTCVDLSGETDPVGTWDGEAPTCSAIQCMTLSAIDNGTISYNPTENGRFGFNTEATHTCNTGYFLSSGSDVRVCGGNDSSTTGMWSDTVPTCTAIMCLGLPDPTNGTVTFSADGPASFMLATVATYNCEPGYVLNSINTTRTCVDLSNEANPVGTWNGDAPTCSAIQCTALAVIDNGTISYNTTRNGQFEFNTEATHTCTTGYFLSNGSDVRVCGGNDSTIGMWSGNVPMCTAITCPALPSIVDGELVDYGSNSPDMSDMLPFGAMGTYKCATGFAPDGGAIVTRTCTANMDSVSGGSFEGVAVCVSIMCPDLANPINGRVTFSPDSLALATVATYNCEPGYGLNSTSTRTCVDLSGETDPVGTWNGDASTCSAIQCTTLEAIDNGVISYNPTGNGQFGFNTEATHTCTTGYFLSSGSDVRVCGGNDSSTTGMWSGTVPTCTAITCPALPSIVDGELVDYGSNSPDMSDMLPFGAMGTYKCATGFAPEGGAMVTRTCIANMDSVSGGSFDGVQAVCVSIMCPDLANPINGRVTFSPDSLALATVATYNCEPGYGLNSTSVRTCVDLSGETDPVGTWNGDASTCSAIQCTTLSAIDNGTISYNPTGNGQFGFNTVATHTCTMGYFLSSGCNVRMCGGDDSSTTGMWSGNVPMCTAIMCPDLADPTNGRVTFSIDDLAPFVLATMATYSCEPGYGLSSAVTRTCVDLSTAGEAYPVGTWNGDAPICSAIQCSALPIISNVVISYNPAGTGLFPFNTEATHTCDNFRTPTNGSDVRLCGGDGSNTTGVWSGTALECSEKSTIGATFDQADYTVAEGSSLTVTGRLTGLTGKLQSNFSLTLSVDFSGDPLTDTNDVTFNPADMIINFVAFESTTFSLTVDADNNDDFEGFHSFMVSLPTDSFYINLLDSDTVSTTVTISDFDDATVSVSTAVVTDGDEGTNVTICASVVDTSSGTIDADIELSFELVPDTADASDYAPVGSFFINLVGGQANIGSEDCVTVSLLEDNILESDQQFSAILSSVNARVDVSEAVIVIINTNNPTLNFLSSDLTVVEGVDRYVYYPLRITNVPAGGLEGLIEYELIVSPSGATLNMDYRVDNPSIVSFGTYGETTSRAELEGALSTPALIEILDDMLLDTDDEDVQVFLLATDNFRSMEIIIVDNERAVVSFDAVSYASTEGLSVSLVLNLTSIPEGGFQDNSLTVTLTTIDQGKTNASDYNISVPFQVRFTSLTPPFAVSDPVVITAVMDDLFEDTETLQVMISDISSLYVMCTECTAYLSFQQAAADIPSWSFDKAIPSPELKAAQWMCVPLCLVSLAMDSSVILYCS